MYDKIVINGFISANSNQKIEKNKIDIDIENINNN